MKAILNMALQTHDTKPQELRIKECIDIRKQLLAFNVLDIAKNASLFTDATNNYIKNKANSENEKCIKCVLHTIDRTTKFTIELNPEVNKQSGIVVKQL